MSNFGYHTELKKYEELDEDELLASLSSEELRELESELADIDPDDNVPIGLRQKDQTAKIPTGTFDRDALLKYWEDENKKLLEDEKEKASPEQVQGVFNSGVTNLSETDKVLIKKQWLENVTVYLLSLILSRSNSRIRVENWNRLVTPERPSGNPIVIDKALEQIISDDPSMIEVNLNNIEDILPETLLRFADALCTNTHVHVFSLANTHADDRVAFAISKMLRENCSIRNLNIESNFVSGQGILALFAALQHNQTLVELRFHNQRHICGGKVEMEMVQLLRENTTLLKLGYQFDLPGPRMAVTSIMTRNQDQQRQKRCWRFGPICKRCGQQAGEAFQKKGYFNNK
uniref:Leiomodin-3 n=1 Tax=Gouania willdenowi TaxID=441366 RepID=A0A8C5HC01_GOUWI